MQTDTPITVLFAEDDDAHAEIVRRNLDDARLPCRLLRVRDGQGALDYLRHEGEFASASDAPRPDLILLDLRMPRVDGLEVLQRLKVDADLRRIPVVVLTTSAAEPDIEKAYACGAASYLVKPVDFKQFSKLIETFGFYWLHCNQYPAGDQPPSFECGSGSRS